jgi:alkylation response protein AidB-like acyl-CoA dehydrogenase
MSQGQPSFIRQLFSGNIDDSLLFPFPTLSEEEHARVVELQSRVGRYLDEHLDPARVDDEERIPDEVLNGLKELGLFGVGIPTDHGGMGLSAGAYTRVFEFVTTRDVGLGIIFGVHQSIGIKGVMIAGTEEQKAKYLPRAATGEWMASFALTEPLAGSDVAGLRARAVRQADGSYLLDGSKIWIGNGSFSEVIVTFAQLEMEVAGERKDRVTAFILRPDMPGYRRGEPLRKMGARGSNQCELEFSSVPVPAENVLGGEGEGFRLAMQVLNSGRTGLAGGAAGGIRQCLQQSAEFAARREQFGRPIGDFELIQEKLARMAADAFAAESVAYLTAGLTDRGNVDYALEAAAAKIWCSDALDRAVDETVQIAGGRGYVKGFPYERAYRDSRITRIFEGTNEVLRLFVGLSGIEEPGEHLQEIGAALREPIRQLGTLAEFAGERVRMALRRGEPAIDAEVHPQLEKHFQYLQDHTRDLRAAAERAIRRWGRRIIDRQLVVARLADMSIELYVRAAFLSRAQAILDAHDRGDSVTAPMPAPIPCDTAAVERMLRTCDLAAQLSGLRFRTAREALHDARDELVVAVSRDVMGEWGNRGGV